MLVSLLIVPDWLWRAVDVGGDEGRVLDMGIDSSL